MFYLAIFLILLGLISLVVLVVSLSGNSDPSVEEGTLPTGSTSERPEAPARLKPEQDMGQDSPLPSRSGLDSPEKAPEEETRIDPISPSEPPPAQETNLPREESMEPVADGARERQEQSGEKTMVPGEQTLRLRQALQLLEDRNRERTTLRTTGEREEKKNEQLIVTGVLFLDHGRQIQYRAGTMPENPESFFSEMKRVDQGSLILQGPRFQIVCGNANYQYGASELEQILFIKGGIALIPLSQKRPVPVFLTEDMDRVRSYVERYSTVAG